mgnify:CR=1 FL=1
MIRALNYILLQVLAQEQVILQDSTDSQIKAGHSPRLI